MTTATSQCTMPMEPLHGIVCEALRSAAYGRLSAALQNGIVSVLLLALPFALLALCTLAVIITLVIRGLQWVTM